MKLSDRYCLFLFYKNGDQEPSTAIHKLVTSLSKENSFIRIIIFEWSSVEAFKPKIRYQINTPMQCVLTNHWGGDIVRLTIPNSLKHLQEMLTELGYKGEADLIGKQIYGI